MMIQLASMFLTHYPTPRLSSSGGSSHIWTQVKSKNRISHDDNEDWHNTIFLYSYSLIGFVV